jgi:DNA-binding HxlR family transcriptional regulator
MGVSVANPALLNMLFHTFLGVTRGYLRSKLSTRLSELKDADMIFRIENRKVPRFVRWDLIEKGWDALPILMSYGAFGSKWYAPSVFLMEGREKWKKSTRRNASANFMSILTWAKEK